MTGVARRRNFLRSCVGKVAQAEPSLPWLKDKESFTELCTLCGKCVDTCPEQIIINGSGGFPTVDFRKGECTFCEACTDVCPEDLFDTSIEKPWNLSLEISSDCFPHKGIVCQSCRDACEYHAIEFGFFTASIPKPSVDFDKCIECGACVAVCPTNAITLVSNSRLESNE